MAGESGVGWQEVWKSSGFQSLTDRRLGLVRVETDEGLEFKFSPK